MFPLHSGSSPGLNQKYYFLVCQMKAHIFVIIVSKFQLQIHYTLEVITENVPISSILILIFLCIFMTASFPVSHFFTFASGEQIRSNLEVKLHKMCLRGQGQSFDSEKNTCHNGHIPLYFEIEICGVIIIQAKH